MTEAAEPPESSTNIMLKCKTVLDLPPSCLEFISRPSEEAKASPHLKECYHEYFVVGTYYLEKEENVKGYSSDLDQEEDEKFATALQPQSKNGSLILFRYQDGNLQTLQTLPYPSAVFDLHFLPGLPVFAIVSSTGTVAIFKLTEQLDTQAVTGSSPAESVLSIEINAVHQVFPENIAPTYFTWAPNSQYTMALATSDGGVYLVTFSPQYDTFQILNNGEPVIRHSEYAWCCSFSPTGDHLYSGGDDNKLRLENLGDTLSILNPEQEIEKSGLYPTGLPGHDAGITFILPVPIQTSESRSQIYLTGSYDDRIRIYSVPSYPSRPKVLSELHLGGGVWRLKFLNYDSNPGAATAIHYTVLASCMHAGARILRISATKTSYDEGAEWEWEISVLAEMRLHKSMNYASDAQPARDEGSRCEKRVFVSSSFYDRLLCVWTWDPEGST